ncbi:uncharacterized protein GGS22DRAFT_54296 [Annulohypoxylon maeteangense]|uniref:uncharacterized protein n=1 Tax=Annulohypoxylon maeteangense TaxID=1927788 RepID=UPI002007A01E|nr:uncharacterized protein GGS22DRAFT_54296 [Annulohypoxylon maeteangense]KAI0882077.1 hypothetical protein GGS22DRAFT_54296 [Annulohypoxylon maeteangense]
MVGVAGRSKGCNTCRRRRVKCDEAKPQCYRCTKAGFECLGYERATQWRHTSVSARPASRLHGPECTEQMQNIRIDFGPAPELSLIAFEGDICTAQMFRNFVWKSYGSLWLDQAAEGRLGRLSLDAVKALARLNFGLSNRVPNFQLQGDAQYGKCLRVLIEELGKDRSGTCDNRTLVVPILVLMMVSAIQADRVAAVFHLRAIGNVLMMCGPRAFQQQPLRNAFEAARSTLLVASLYSRRRIFLESPCWRDSPYELDPFTKPEQSHLLDIFVMIPGFLEEINGLDDETCDLSDEFVDPSLISDEHTEHLTSLCRRIDSQLEKLYRWRWEWQRKYGHRVTTDKSEWCQGSPSPKSESSSSNPTGIGRLQFDRPVYANDIMLYNAALMFLMTLIWRLQPSRAASVMSACAQRASNPSISSPRSPKSPASPLPSSYFEPLIWPGAALSIREPAIEICRVFDWQCRHHEQHAFFNDQTCMYLFPIGMARTVLAHDPECRMWIDGMLDFNPMTTGYGRGGGSIVGFSSFITQAAIDPDSYDPEDSV